jgi:hypothetical protein
VLGADLAAEVRGACHETEGGERHGEGERRESPRQCRTPAQHERGERENGADVGDDRGELGRFLVRMDGALGDAGEVLDGVLGGITGEHGGGGEPRHHERHEADARQLVAAAESPQAEQREREEYAEDGRVIEQ